MKKYIPRIFLGAGLLVMLYPVYFFVCLIYIDFTTPVYETVYNERLYSLLPEFLRSRFYSTWVAIFSCLLAAILSLGVFITDSRRMKKAGLALLAAALLLMTILFLGGL